MPEKTMKEAAQELHEAAMALRELIEREYPSRREIERRFQSKTDVARNWKIILALIVSSTLLSSIGTVTAVSACFLGNADHPDICNLLPGYAEAEAANKRRINLFEGLYERTDSNGKRLDRLEKLLEEERGR